jgi:hypothetical protein
VGGWGVGEDILAGGAALDWSAICCSVNSPRPATAVTVCAVATPGATNANKTSALSFISSSTFRRSCFQVKNVLDQIDCLCGRILLE